MIVRKIEMSGYRNCCDLTLEPSPSVNVFYGQNAQGKTNILESIWLFTGSRSFRGTKDCDLIRFGLNSCRLDMDFFSFGRENHATLKISETRKALLNGVDLERPIKLAGEFCAVIFSPEHLGLVKGSPQLRRKFIDSAICQIWPKHLVQMINYNRALSHRNALLKDIPRHSELMDTVDIWNEKLARIGSQIIYARLRYLDKLKAAAGKIYDGISCGAETMELSYKNGEQKNYQYDGAEAQSEAVSQIYESLLRGLSSHLRADMENGYTHDGPHRDDIDIKINGFSAKQYGSQGQQRSAALTLKLAEAGVLLDKTGEPPVLLLDDVMSELDSARQNYILNNVKGWQVFITCCDPSVTGNLECGRVYRVQNGCI